MSPAFCSGRGGGQAPALPAAPPTGGLARAFATVPASAQDVVVSAEIDEPMIDLASRIRDVPDFPQKGILFKDITTLLKDGPAFKAAIDLMTSRVKEWGVEVVVGMESRGF